MYCLTHSIAIYRNISYHPSCAVKGITSSESCHYTSLVTRVWRYFFIFVLSLNCSFVVFNLIHFKFYDVNCIINIIIIITFPRNCKNKKKQTEKRLDSWILATLAHYLTTKQPKIESRPGGYFVSLNHTSKPFVWQSAGPPASQLWQRSDYSPGSFSSNASSLYCHHASTEYEKSERSSGWVCTQLPNEAGRFESNTPWPFIPP